MKHSEMNKKRQRKTQEEEQTSVEHEEWAGEHLTEDCKENSKIGRTFDGREEQEKVRKDGWSRRRRRRIVGNGRSKLAN